MDLIQEAIAHFLNVIKTEYVKHVGRATRKQYWMFALTAFVICIIPVVGWIAALFLIVPGICLGIRRLHDTGRSGWWTLVGLVPFIGFLVLLFFLVQPSQTEDNQYGPKAA